MFCFVILFTVFILFICNFDFGFNRVNNNSNINNNKSKQSESKNVSTLSDKDKSNSESSNDEDELEDDSYVRKTVGVLLDTENLGNESYNNNVLSALKRADEDFDIRED